MSLDKNNSSYQRHHTRKSMSIKNCAGCEQNFYNDNNQLGVKVCWHLETAFLVKRKKVPMSLTPPWTMKPITIPSCYQVRGYVFVDPKTNRT